VFGFLRASVGVTSHHKPIERRPFYAALGLALVSVAVILAFGATAQNATPIFDATKAQADLPAIISVPAPSVIPLPGTTSRAPSTAITTVAKPSSSAAQPTPFASTYRSLVTTDSQAAGAVSTTTPLTSAGPMDTRKPSARITTPAKRAHPAPTTHHSLPPSARPTARPTIHPTTPSGTGANSSVPWWWYPVPHLPSLPSVPTFPRLPVATHTHAFPTGGTSVPRTPSSGIGSRHGRR
jgi:hypothetical protein